MVALDYKQLTEQELSQLYAQGSKEAFSCLIEKVEPKLYNQLIKIGASKSQAEDLVQESYFRALRAHNFRSNSASFYTWISQIARNLVYDQVKKQKRRKVTNLEIEVSDSRLNPEQILIAEEKHSRINDSIKKLPEDSYNVIDLYYFKRIPIKEIAELLEIPIGTVCTRLHSARDKLRKSLERYVNL